ncbi:MAG: redoxin domain-containing protein [Chitinophagaceae bacterium]|nr:redoxin domain-containing protein [Chitinophagaceae bacterium]
MRYLFFLFLFFASGAPVAAQDNKSDKPPVYAQYPLPQFSILLTDSATWYTKKDLPPKKKTIFMVFSPECEHCKHEIELIKKNIRQFSGTQIVMTTTLSFDKMKDFYNHYELKNYKNIVVGRDTRYFFPSYFKVHFLPFMAIYDKNFKLLKTFEGTTKWDELAKYL